MALYLCVVIVLWITVAPVVNCQAEICQPPDSHSYCISQGVDNCAPEDRLVTSPTDQCRTSTRFAPDHNDILIPPEWELMFDSYDYESLVGPVFLSREFDNDGDVSADQWEDRGGICQRGLRVCAHTLGAQDNWVFSPHIKYPPGSTTLGGGLPTDIYLDVSFRFTQCSGACVNNFADVFRYDTNSIASESERTDRNNYLSTPLFGTGTEMTTSRLDQTGSSMTVSDTRTLAITSPSSSRTNGFHFGIRDSGNCGQINRIFFYYTPCKKRQDGLVNYPELVRAPNGSPPNEGMACCAPNSHPTTSLTFRAHSATDGSTGDEGCERTVTCECNAGYRLNAAGTGCQGCETGTYRSEDDPHESCLPCPLNTIQDVLMAPICNCSENHYRNDTEGPEFPCSTISDPPGPVLCSEVSGTFIRVEWTPPTFLGGRTDTYYIVEYQAVSSIDNFIASRPVFDTTYTISRLESITQYRVEVYSENGVSDQDTRPGIRSTRMSETVCTTGEGVPEAPSSVQVVGNIVFLWQPPSKPNGVITGYQIVISYNDSLTGQVVMETPIPLSRDTFVYDLRTVSLPENVTATITLNAQTAAGFGELSAPLSFASNPTCPTTPPPTTPPPPVTTQCPTCPESVMPTDGVYFMLSGRTYYDGDIILINDIGEGDDALLCMTDNTECCRTGGHREFFYPDGTAVGFSSTNSLYRNRGEQFIGLNRRNGATSPLGGYRCDIPDASGVTRSIFINIASTMPPVITCPTVTTTTCPPTPTRPPPTEVSCPPTLPPPTCPPTELSTPCPVTTCPPEQGDVYFMLRGKNYTDGDIVMITDIGEGDNALLCVTDNTECCDPADGEFFYPDGTAVGFSISNSIYRNRGEQLIRLNRKNGPTSPLGRYRCAIPDASGVTRSVYVNIVAGGAPPPVTCPVLLNPVNGGVRVLSLSIAVGSLATYTCNPSYTLSGSSRRTCLPNGQWSGNAPTCQRGAIGFMLRGEIFTNGSSISLENIGKTDEALIFRTEIKDCCRSQKIGQCYDPNGVALSNKGANSELYRNRDVQLVRLNKNKIFTGQAAIPGLYCCTVPNNDGILHRICANIIA